MRINNLFNIFLKIYVRLKILKQESDPLLQFSTWRLPDPVKYF